jgi:hypothetical protein
MILVTLLYDHLRSYKETNFDSMEWKLPLASGEGVYAYNKLYYCQGQQGIQILSELVRENNALGWSKPCNPYVNALTYAFYKRY